MARTLTGIVARDMRRSGFVHYAERGVAAHLICAVSGHTNAEGNEIIETYLPKTPQQASLAIRMMIAAS